MTCHPRDLSCRTVELPLISVVVPTCHRADLLALCLDAIETARAGLAPGQVEVIVSDDSRDDASQALVRERYPTVHWTQGPRRGPACNRNHGARLARGRWIAFTDDDCIPDAGWLAAFAKAFGDDVHPLYEGRTRADRERRSFAEEAPVNETGGYLWSCNMAITAELFKRIGGFRESFPYPALEDVDLRLRLEQAGVRPRFVAAASVCHPYRPMRDLAFFRRHTASYAHLLELHPSLQRALGWRAVALNVARQLWALAREARRYGTPGTGRMLYAIAAKAGVETRWLLRRRPAAG